MRFSSETVEATPHVPAHTSKDEHHSTLQAATHSAEQQLELAGGVVGKLGQLLLACRSLMLGVGCSAACTAAICCSGASRSAGCSVEGMQGCKVRTGTLRMLAQPLNSAACLEPAGSQPNRRCHAQRCRTSSAAAPCAAQRSARPFTRAREAASASRLRKSTLVMSSKKSATLWLGGQGCPAAAKCVAAAAAGPA